MSTNLRVLKEKKWLSVKVNASSLYSCMYFLYSTAVAPVHLTCWHMFFPLSESGEFSCLKHLWCEPATFAHYHAAAFWDTAQVPICEAADVSVDFVHYHSLTGFLMHLLLGKNNWHTLFLKRCDKFRIITLHVMFLVSTANKPVSTLEIRKKPLTQGAHIWKYTHFLTVRHNSWLIRCNRIQIIFIVAYWTAFEIALRAHTNEEEAG